MRNRELKDSAIPWIGDIPNGWGVNMLSSLFDEHKQKNKGLVETNLLSLSYGKIIRKDINTKEGLLPESFDGYNVISSGDIVFRLTDLQNDKRSLRTGLCTENGIITSAYVTIRGRHSLNSAYYHYLFHSYDFCKVFYGMGEGVRQGMNYGDLRKLLILLPSLSEQQKIASFLDRKCAEIDEMIALQEKIIDELKAYKQSVITEAVTKGLNPDVPMKDSGSLWIGEIPTNWNLARIGDVGEYKKGPFGSAITLDMFVPKGEHTIKVYEQQNAIKKDWTLGYYYLPVDYFESCLKGFEVLPNDIIVSCAGTIGEVYQLPMDVERGIINQALMRMRINSTINLSYFLYIFDLILKREAERSSNGTAIKNIPPFSIFKKILVPLPSLEEQQEIAEYLNAKCTKIDNLISIKLSKIDSLKEYKKSIIYEYVTGKKEVIE